MTETWLRNNNTHQRGVIPAINKMTGNMTYQKFRAEMRRASALQKTASPDMAEYWSGYIRGLRRSYHGDRFGTEAEHTLWLSLVDRSDDTSRSRGTGYRDGLAYNSIASKMGRPTIGGVILPTITVPPEIKKGLERLSENTGISIPDIRREAYKRYIESEKNEK